MGEMARSTIPWAHTYKLTLPHLEPDELALSHKLRIERLNPGRDIDSGLSKLVEGRAELPLTLLAAAAGKTLDRYVVEHTLVPFFRTVVRAHPIEYGDPSFVATLTTNQTMRPALVWGRLCSECVSEELGRIGTSYWHRQHHVPGDQCCAIHQRPLLYCDRADAFRFLPHELLAEARTYSEELLRAQESTYVQRYVALTRAICSKVRATRMHDTVALMRTRAMGRFPTMSRSRAHVFLEQLASQCLPDAWVQDLFGPSLANRRMVRHLSFVGVLHPLEVHATRLLVAAALIYESADEAIAAFTDPPPYKYRARIARVAQKVDWRSKRVECAYRLLKGDHRRMREQLCMDARYMRTRLSEFGMPDLGNVTDATRRALIEFCAGDSSIKDVCSATGCSAEELEDLLRASAFRVAKLLEPKRLR